MGRGAVRQHIGMRRTAPPPPPTRHTAHRGAVRRPTPHEPHTTRRPRAAQCPRGALPAAPQGPCLCAAEKRFEEVLSRFYSENVFTQNYYKMLPNDHEHRILFNCVLRRLRNKFYRCISVCARARGPCSVRALLCAGHGAGGGGLEFRASLCGGGGGLIVWWGWGPHCVVGVGASQHLGGGFKGAGGGGMPQTTPNNPPPHPNGQPICWVSGFRQFVLPSCCPPPPPRPSSVPEHRFRCPDAQGNPSVSCSAFVRCAHGPRTRTMP